MVVPPRPPPNPTLCVDFRAWRVSQTLCLVADEVSTFCRSDNVLLSRGPCVCVVPAEALLRTSSSYTSQTNSATAPTASTSSYLRSSLAGAPSPTTYPGAGLDPSSRFGVHCFLKTPTPAATHVPLLIGFYAYCWVGSTAQTILSASKRAEALYLDWNFPVCHISGDIISIHELNNGWIHALSASLGPLHFLPPLFLSLSVCLVSLSLSSCSFFLTHIFSSRLSFLCP